MIRFDGHLHTRASHDSHACPRRIVGWAIRRGLGAIAVTDHDTMDGVDLIRRAVDALSDPLVVVPGIEVTTSHRTHVLGYFLSRPPRSTVLGDVVREIHDLGGVVGIPHPFRRDTGLLANLEEGRHPRAEVEAVLAAADLIELSNAKSGPRELRRLWEVLDDLPRTPFSAGSDAHVPHEVGRSYLELEAIDPEGLRAGGVVVRRDYHGAERPDDHAPSSIRAMGARARSLVPVSLKGPWREVKRRVRETLEDRREPARTAMLPERRWYRDPTTGEVVCGEATCTPDTSDHLRKVPA